MTYVKLFQSILQSTIWQEPTHVRLVWITLLASSDLNGNVSASVPGLAHTARVELREVEEAIHKLLSPDPYSRTPDFEGRRIEPIDGGWHILNYLKYKHIISAENEREANRIRQKRHRDKLKSVTDSNALSQQVTRNNLIDIDIESTNPLPLFDDEEYKTKPVTMAKNRHRSKRGSAAAQILKDPKAQEIFEKAYRMHPRRKTSAGDLRPAGNQAKGAKALLARLEEGVITWEDVPAIENAYLEHPNVKSGYAQNFETFWGEEGQWMGMLQVIRKNAVAK